LDMRQTIEGKKERRITMFGYEKGNRRKEGKEDNNVWI